MPRSFSISLLQNGTDMFVNDLALAIDDEGFRYAVHTPFNSRPARAVGADQRKGIAQF